MPDGLYDWYQKVAQLMGKQTEPMESYSKTPIDSWMRMIGLKRQQLPEDIIGKGEAARQAAELTESKARNVRGY